ncbi:MAG: DNA repair protein [Eubacteriales bacterium]|nr:DNA repair protein [Eubacteriales bacterium]
MSRDKGINLKRLSRQELLEMLIDEEKRIQQLEAELAAAKAELADRRIRIENSGSIAEAALKLNGIFEAAQAAADQYLENVKRANEL